MGFLDKAKQLAQQAETQLNNATGQAGGAQSARVADTWLKELGQWVYADRMGRDPRAASEIEVRIQQLQQWEQQNGAQVPMPFPSPGTAPGGMAPARRSRCRARPHRSPARMSDARPPRTDPGHDVGRAGAAAPIPGTLSEPPGDPGSRRPCRAPVAPSGRSTARRPPVP